MAWKGLLAKYSEFLPINKATPLITLYEGNTPLVKSENLGKDLDIELFFKYEGLNPTGSFKDRGMVMAVAKALENKSKMIMCASTGNTSASAAAYGARFGLKTFVLIPDGKIAQGKLAQAYQYGAKVITIKGNFDEALELVKEITESQPITLVNSLNPYRLEGQKTGAFEVVDALTDSPDILAIPVGNAGNITAYWMGFNVYFQAKRITKLPKMYGFQASGAAPLVVGHPVDEPETIATAIRIGNPASGDRALKARDESGGLIEAVTDEEILEAYRELSRLEGIFAEPASAASVAGIIKCVKEKKIDKGAKVVCVLTGHGLKDPTTSLDSITEPLVVESTISDVMALLENEGGLS